MQKKVTTEKENTKKEASNKDPGAISSAKDLSKMKDNPSGKYYLTQDITVPKNTQIFDDFSAGATPFTGTFDGRGHKIKGYKVDQVGSEYLTVSLFGNTKNATFKNLTLSDVNISIEGDAGAHVAALSNGSAKCSKVTVTGEIFVSGNETTSWETMEYEVYGFCDSGTFTNCTNKADLTAECRVSYFVGNYIAGIAEYGTFKNCKNSGTISVTGNAASGEVLHVAGISVAGTLTGCSNLGTIKAKCLNGESGYGLYAAGISAKPDKITKCSNSGTVTVSNLTSGDVRAAGVASYIDGLQGAVGYQCANSGTVSIKQLEGRFSCGGVFGEVNGSTKECYNTGKVTVTATQGQDNDMGEVGGVIGLVGRVSECYNIGTISTNTKSKVGGIAGFSEYMGE